MKKLLAIALPVCFLIGCSSEPVNDAPYALKIENGKIYDENGKEIKDSLNKFNDDSLLEESETKKLPVPDLKAGFDDYGYLVKYIGKPGKKHMKQQHVWSQTFGEDITYDMINDIESNGYNYRITFAGYPKEEVVRFVEWFQSGEDMGWDKEKTVYGPKDENELGCFYSVKQDKKGNYFMECSCVC